MTLVISIVCLPTTMKPRQEGWAASRSDLEDLLWPGVDAPRRLDQRGRSLAAEALRDTVAVVSFVASDCSVVCIIRARDLDAVARELPEAVGARAVFLAVAMGDARDAGPLRAFAESVVGADSPLRFVTNDAEGTARLAATLRYPAADLPEPPPRILLFDRRGRLAMTYGGDPVDRPRLSRDIALLQSFETGIAAAHGTPAEASPQF